MESALSFVRGVQGLFWVCALLFGFGAGADLVSYMGGDGMVEPLTLIIELAFTAFFVFGALLLRRNPLPWSLGAAVPMTLIVAAFILARRGLPIIPAIIMVMSWVSAYLGLRVRTLRRQNPELAKKEAEEALALPRALMVGAAALAFCLLLGAGTNWIQRKTPPVQAKIQAPKASLEPSLKRFEEAWNTKDLKALGALYPERLTSRGRRLGRRMEQHGFESFPKLKAGPRIEDKGLYRRSVYYETEEGGIELVYKYTKDQWELVALRM